HPQVALVLIIAADQIPDGSAVGDGAMPVAELPVIIALEAGMGVMVRDGKGVHKPVGRLDGGAEELVKAVLVNAFPGNGTPETAQTAPVKGELPQVDHPALKGKGSPEICDHVLQVSVLGTVVGHDDYIFISGLGH